MGQAIPGDGEVAKDRPDWVSRPRIRDAQLQLDFLAIFGGFGNFLAHAVRGKLRFRGDQHCPFEMQLCGLLTCG